MARYKIPAEMHLQCKNPLQIGNMASLSKIWCSNGGVGVNPKLIAVPANTIIQLSDETHTMFGVMQREKIYETSDDYNSYGVAIDCYATNAFPYPNVNSTYGYDESVSVGPMIFGTEAGSSQYFGNKWRLNPDGVLSNGSIKEAPFVYVEELLNDSYVPTSFKAMKSEVQKIVNAQKLPLNQNLLSNAYPQHYRLAVICTELNNRSNIQLYCLCYLNKDTSYYHSVYMYMNYIFCAYQYLFLKNNTSDGILALI